MVRMNHGEQYQYGSLMIAKTRLLVNDCMTAIPGTKTFWHDLQEWFDMRFVSVDYADKDVDGNFVEDWGHSLIIRNGSYFGPIETSAPQISIIQDIMEEGPARKMQNDVMKSSAAVVFNSDFTASRYIEGALISHDHKIDKVFTDLVNQQGPGCTRVIPLPVDFTLFEPGNPMGLQQALSLPDGAVCWIGASQGAAAQVKGWDTFLSIVRNNPDIPFVGVFKDALPEYGPPNLRMFCKVPHEELVKILGACRVGLCTSRMESQHLAGIEMGACGLPLVAPPVGIYWEREDFPGILLTETTVGSNTEAIRASLSQGSPSKVLTRDSIRNYWMSEFSKPVIRKQWEALVKEVECSG